MTVNGAEYNIIRFLGKGKGGYSYLAERDGKQVMVKVISKLNRFVRREELFMLRPTAIKVEVLCEYQILVEFDNGEKKQFDVEPYIQGEWYGKLRVYEYFKRVSVDGFTVVWPDGQDICPDELYELGVTV